MTSIAQNRENDQREISATLKKFYADYGIAGLLRACRGEKEKEISAFRIFQYLLCLVFSDRSMYMQIVTGRFTEGFCKNTVLPVSQRGEDQLGTFCSAALGADHQPDDPAADEQRPQGCVHHRRHAVRPDGREEDGALLEGV